MNHDGVRWMVIRERDVKHSSDYGQTDRSAPRHRRRTVFGPYYLIGVSLVSPSSKDLSGGVSES